MLSLRHTLQAGICAAFIGLAAQAQAAVVTFDGTVGGFSGSGINVYTDSQKAFFDPLQPARTTFSFSFQYDPASLGSNSGGAYTSYATTLVSGRVGTMTDFSGFAPTIQLSQNGTTGVWDVMNFSLHRLDLYVPENFNRFTSQITFTMVDQQGLLFNSVNGLPSLIDPTTLEQKNAEFRIDGSRGYRYLSGVTGVAFNATNPGGGGGPITQPPVSGVPEPGTWAMMILGFLGVGTALRHARQRQPVLA